MKIEKKEYRTIWFENNTVKIIDQTKLPHQFIIKELKTVKDAINAIKTMEVRGAPLIGATAAYGLVLAIIENNDKSFLNNSSSSDTLISIESFKLSDFDFFSFQTLELNSMIFCVNSDRFSVVSSTTCDSL